MKIFVSLHDKIIDCEGVLKLKPKSWALQPKNAK